MQTYSEHVNEQIKLNNSWYTSEQFQWASLPYIKKIYQGRFRFILNEVHKYLFKNPGEAKLIELGCGDGYWLKQLENRQIKQLNLEGTDYNKLRLNRAKKLLSADTELFLADLNEFKPQRKYDIVLCLHVIEHIPDDVSFLKKIKKLISQKGVLILATPNEGSYLEIRRNAKYKYYDTTDHVHFYTEELIKARLRKSGYEIKRIYHDPVYIGNDEVFYKVLTWPYGYKILSNLTKIFPSLCSGYIFSCQIKSKKLSQ